ncbi:MFS transporter [Commensalibacter oyaizuii]|uniref:MFS transporter n=1 Tax=Commensalibacter oyaizuii TaxID=3043873 RepID=A0ABT6Q290_9PROT|nr:MFS transporter [Commensalibacter sp. TBRC 16381]MDI2091227.1 MFS transporter [Commensalibacter sp. TBRC 16381]
MQKSSALSLKSLWFLCFAQSCGVLSENMIKNAMLVMALFVMGYQNTGLTAIAGGLFILPYACFSATAGQLADKFSKHRVMIAVKTIQLLFIPVVTVGFVYQNITLLLICLFFLGTAEAFYCPLKYSIIPEIVDQKRILFGNSVIETSTFIAILIGMIAGGSVILFSHGIYWVCGSAFILSLLGLGSIFKIMHVAPADPSLKINWNIAKETLNTIAMTRKNRKIWLCVLGISWFWTVGAVISAGIFDLSSAIIHHNGQFLTTIFLSCFSIGIAIGSIICARLLKGRISGQYVPFAAIGISIFCLDFGLASLSIRTFTSLHVFLTSFTGIRIFADLIFLSICSGIFSVPLYAMIQDQSPKSSKARIVAGNNIINAIMMVIGSFIWAKATAYTSNIAYLFIGLSVINFGIAIYIMRLLPAEILKTFFKAYFNLFHGVKITGMENFHQAGEKVVIISNHTSFMDATLLSCYLPQKPAFAIYTKTAEKWWARPFLATVNIFKVDIQSPYAIKDMIYAVRNNKEKLVIFPEGRLTKTGNLMKIYEGAGIVASSSGARILPVHIDGLQFTPWGRMRGKLRMRWFPRLSITILPSFNIQDYTDHNATPRQNRANIGKILQRTLIDSAFKAKNTDKTLFQTLLDAKDIYGKKTEIIEDIRRDPLTYDRLTLGAVLLGRQFTNYTDIGECVGLMLPTSCGGLVALMGLSAFGRVLHPVNVSTGAENIKNISSTAAIKTIITSRLFIEKAKLHDTIDYLKPFVQFVYLEDIKNAIGLSEKIRAKLDILYPKSLPGVKANANDPAIILATSGSEGQPKAVVLSHKNILTNCNQLACSVDFSSADRVFNAMPIFHSFGLTGAILLPLLYGVRTFHYPNPLHYKNISSLIYDTDATICFGTDTFLNGWAKYAHPYDFYAMRYIFAGGEKVKEETRRLYADTFGVRVFEGYGATETAPVMAINTPMNSRGGTVGKFLPGIDYKLEPVPGIDKGGKLIVKGDNIMIGYMLHTNPGKIQPPQDGWYDTGDIVEIDQDGFVIICGRIKRFAKIAGEMISMTAAETLATTLWPTALHAVVSLPDPKKGERLSLITTQQNASVSQLLTYAKERNIAEIMIPRSIKIVQDIPLFATGKVNYPELQKYIQNL